MASNHLPSIAANDNDRDPLVVSLAQSRALASLPAYLRGGRI